MELLYFNVTTDFVRLVFDSSLISKFSQVRSINLFVYNLAVGKKLLRNSCKSYLNNSLRF